MRKFLAESFLALALVFSFSFPVHAQEDNTTCFVLDGGDDVTLPEYPQLRRKVQQGYNRPTDRFCTELIRIKSGLKVTLLDSLPIGNEKDGDCPAAAGRPAVCGDGLNLLIDAQSGRVTIDVSAVPGGACGIELNSGNIKMTGIDIQATAEQAANRTALCNKADGNDLSDVKVNGKSFNCGNGKVDTGEACDDGNTSEDDECDNQCKAIAQPSPEASPSPSPQPPVLNAPTGLVALNDPSSSGGALKVLLQWEHHEGETKKAFKISPALLGKLDLVTLDKVEPQYYLKPGVSLKPNLSIDDLKPGVYKPFDPDIFLIPKDYTFDIERTLKTGDTCGTFSSIGNVNGVYKTFQDPTVAAKTTYCYRVRATRGSEHTDWSNVAEVRTPDPALVVPTELEATALSEDRIYVRWTHPLETGAINFRLERGNASCTPASFVAIATAISEKEYNDTGLDPATTYCYRVAALSNDTPAEQSLYSNTDTAKTLEVGASPYPTPEATPSPSPLATPMASPQATPEATPLATPEATPEATPVVTPTDKDGDGVKNEDDNCPDQANADQKDLDGDGMGNPCDPDADGDGVLNKDEIAQGTDPLDGDTDDDSVPDNTDNCPSLGNSDQRDSDGDGLGDSCDSSGSNSNPTTGGGCSLSMLYANPPARLIYLAGVALLGYAMMRKRAK